MQKIHPDAQRARRCRGSRNRLRWATATERDRMLYQFGDEIRALTPLAIRASNQEWDVGGCLELTTALGVVIGGWMTTEPTNPNWPGRDRLFLTRGNDVMAASAALSTLGFFQPEYVAKLVDAAMAGDETAIPGLESPGAGSQDQIESAWESALQSAWSKRQWRQHFGPTAGIRWADPQWRIAPDVWRSCIIVDCRDDAISSCRALPNQSSERSAGMTALITAPQDESTTLALQWRESGWDSVVVGRWDGLGLYNSLTAPMSDKPLAIVLAMSQATSLNTNVARRGERQSSLIGELSDDQFNAIMDESLHL